jgi:hypothetical protein
MRVLVLPTCGLLLRVGRSATNSSAKMEQYCFGDTALGVLINKAALNTNPNKIVGVVTFIASALARPGAQYDK